MKNFDFLRPNGTLYRLTEHIQMLVYINFLWIFFSLVGLIIFGILPATVAMFIIINKWIKEGNNLKVFKIYWREYKNNFIKTNITGLIMVVVGYNLYFNFIFFKSQEGAIYLVLLGGTLGLSILYLIVFLYIFPVFVKYPDLRILNLLKNSLFIGILTPGYTLLMILTVVIISIIFIFVSFLLPLVSASSLGVVIMWLASKSFDKVDKKVNRY